jgi:hypothetical protein
MFLSCTLLINYFNQNKCYTLTQKNYSNDKYIHIKHKIKDISYNYDFILLGYPYMLNLSPLFSIMARVRFPEK